MKKPLTIIFTGAILITITQTTTPKYYVLLTIDLERDLPPVMNTTQGIQATNQLLQYLEKENIKATFLVTGWVAENHPELIKKIKKQGHEIGLHGYHHENYTTLNKTETLKTIKKGKETLQKLGITPTTFRTPYQSYTQNVEQALQQEKFTAELSYRENTTKKNNLLLISTTPLIYPSSTYPQNWTTIIQQTLKNKNTIIIGIHSWELIKLPTIKGYEQYTTPTGEYTWTQLKQTIQYAKKTQGKFVTTKEYTTIKK